MSVWTGSCGSLSCVGGNDDSCSLQSSVTFATTNGAKYFIFVYGYGGDVGGFELAVSSSRPPTAAPTLSPASMVEVGCLGYAFFDASKITNASLLPNLAPFHRYIFISLLLQRSSVDNRINDTWIYFSRTSLQR